MDYTNIKDCNHNIIGVCVPTRKNLNPDYNGCYICIEQEHLNKVPMSYCY